MTPNQSHGHVTPNADGYLARCGGPKICKVCLAELAQLRAKSAPAEPVSREAVEVVGYMSCDGLDNGLIRRTSYKTYTVPVMTVAQYNRIVADLTANRDALLNVMRARKMLPKCEPSPDAELVELLREARELIEHGDFREGHCMCGSAVEAHGFGDGHSPVDAGVYYAGQVMERIDAELASLKGVEE